MPPLYNTCHPVVQKSVYSFVTELCASCQVTYLCQALKDSMVTKSKPLPFDIYIQVGQKCNRDTLMYSRISVVSTMNRNETRKGDQEWWGFFSRKCGQGRLLWWDYRDLDEAKWEATGDAIAVKCISKISGQQLDCLVQGQIRGQCSW